jgi:hypothetical protein
MMNIFIEYFHRIFLYNIFIEYFYIIFSFEYISTLIKNIFEIFILFSEKFSSIISLRNKYFFNYFLIENYFENSLYKIKMQKQL